MSGRAWLILTALALGAIFFVGGNYSAKKAGAKAAVGCAIQESPRACAERQCTLALAVRGLLPSPVPPIRWETYEARRRPDLVVVTVFNGEYQTPGGQPRWVQCQMVGKTAMEARGLLSKPDTPNK